MEITTSYKFDKEDLEKIKNGIPKNPCDSCGTDPISCCGCQKYSQYAKKIKELDDRHILEITGNASALKDLIALKKNTTKKIEELIKTLPDEVVQKVLFSVKGDDSD